MSDVPSFSHFSVKTIFHEGKRKVSQPTVSPVAYKSSSLSPRWNLFNSIFTDFNLHSWQLEANKCSSKELKRRRKIFFPDNLTAHATRRTREKIKSDSMRTDDCAKNVWTPFALCCVFFGLKNFLSKHAGLKIARMSFFTWWRKIPSRERNVKNILNVQAKRFRSRDEEKHECRKSNMN